MKYPKQEPYIANKPMTVKQLKKVLEQYPDNMEVFLCGGKTDFTYGLLNSIRKQEIRFSESEDDDSDPQAYVECVILDEE